MRSNSSKRSPTIKKNADDNKTDFNEIEDVLQIYNHAVTL